MNKIRNLVRSITNKSDNFSEKYTKTKFDSDDHLLMIMLELYGMGIVVKSAFHKGNKYYSQVFSVGCL